MANILLACQHIFRLNFATFKATTNPKSVDKKSVPFHFLSLYVFLFTDRQPTVYQLSQQCEDTRVRCIQIEYPVLLHIRTQHAVHVNMHMVVHSYHSSL